MPPKPLKSPRPRLTHFLCLPLITTQSKPVLEASLARFKARVAIQNDDKKNASSLSRENELIPEKAIRPLGTLHLTIGVMSLMEQASLNGALNLLESLDLSKLLSDVNDDMDFETKTNTCPDSSATNTTGYSYSASSTVPLTISLLGLQTMSKPTKTSVLYIEPFDPTSRIEKFCLSLRTIFERASYIVPDNRELRLHATVMNTVYAAPNGRKGTGNEKPNGQQEQERKDMQEPGPSNNDKTNLDEHTRVQTHSTATDEAQASGRNKNSRQVRGKSNFRRFLDVTSILSEFHDFEWARDFRIEKVAICEMGAKQVFNEAGDVVAEEYVEVLSKNMP